MGKNKIKKGDLVKVFWKDAVQKKVSQKDIDLEITGLDFLADKITYGKYEKDFKDVIMLIHEFCPEDLITDETIDATFIPKMWITKIEKSK